MTTEDLQKTKKMQALWCTYFILTDRFDRATCTGPQCKDGNLPANGDQAKKINQYEFKVKQAILRVALVEKMDRLDLEAARAEAVKLSHFAQSALATSTGMEDRILKELERMDG